MSRLPGDRAALALLSAALLLFECPSAGQQLPRGASFTALPGHSSAPPPSSAVARSRLAEAPVSSCPRRCRERLRNPLGVHRPQPSLPKADRKFSLVKVEGGDEGKQDLMVSLRAVLYQ